MKRMTPKKRKQSGILLIVLAIIFITSWTIISIIRNSIDNIIFLQAMLSVVWLVQGVYYIVTLKEYTERYFPTQSFAQPKSADGLHLDDNSEELQKEIIKEAQKYTIEDFNNLKLRLLFGIIAFCIFCFAIPNYPLWIIAIVIPIFAIALWVNWHRLKPGGEVFVGKFLFVTSIVVLLLSPPMFLLMYFLTRIIAIALIISIFQFLLSAMLYFKYVKDYKNIN